MKCVLKDTKESEKIYQNGKKWIDITPFIDYFLDTIEKGMITLVECCRRAVIRGDSSIAELREIMFKKD